MCLLLVEADLHPVEIQGQLEAHLLTGDLQDHVFRVLELGDFLAAGHRDASLGARIDPFDVPGGGEIDHVSDERGLGGSDGCAEADASDGDGVLLAFEGQGTAAAADADDESGLVDVELDLGARFTLRDG